MNNTDSNDLQKIIFVILVLLACYQIDDNAYALASANKDYTYEVSSFDDLDAAIIDSGMIDASSEIIDSGQDVE